MNQKPDLSSYISEGELCKRWKCHPVTVKSRAKKGYLGYVVENRERHYLLSDVIKTEKVKPIRPYIRVKKRKSLRLEKIVNTTARKAKVRSDSRLRVEPSQELGIFARLLFSLKRLFGF